MGRWFESIRGQIAAVAELADALDLGSNAARRGSSTLSGRTNENRMKEKLTLAKIDQILAKSKPRQVVALVDDDPLTHDLVGRALRDQDFEVHHFKLAEEFLEASSQLQLDALIIEAVLPGVSGLTVLDEIRPRSPEQIIPALVLSKRDDIRAKLLAFRRGAWDYMIKPISGEEVAVRVRTLTRAKILREMSEVSSVSDPLTGTHNQKYLLLWLEKEIQRIKRYGVESSCVLLGLDRFREIHSKSVVKLEDLLLKEFADFLTKNLRGSDVIGRKEGGEFFILMPHTPKEQAMAVCRRLRHLTQSSFCMGITSCRPQEEIDSHALLERAEEALTKAKAVGIGETAVV